MSLPSIEVEITFISATEGGRKSPPQLNVDCIYRPHLVVGSPHQRKAIVEDNEIKETYIGVAFRANQQVTEFSKPFRAELVLMYHPHPVYESLVAGTTFTIREGASIVGYGLVKKSVLT